MIKYKTKKIVVGMSGGVDSSMALVLLKKQGWQPIGISLKYAIWQNKENLLRENVCCSTESFEIAKNICQKLNVPYHIFNVSKEFKKEVIDYFVSELKNNRTPNPCIICNRYLKFKKLFEWAEKHNRFARFGNEECWIYQGDGEDHLESLVCPVVISPKDLLELITNKSFKTDSKATAQAKRYY